MKRCCRCRETKPLSEFPKNGSGKLRPDCVECRRARKRALYQQNIERDKAAQLAYRQRTREWAREASRQWRAENPDYYALNAERLRHAGRVKAAVRRAAQRALETEPIDPLVVLELDDGVCGICGTDVDPTNFQLDHIIPVACGGPHLYGNVQVAHPKCNQKKGKSLWSIESWVVDPHATTNAT